MALDPPVHRCCLGFSGQHRGTKASEGTDVKGDGQEGTGATASCHSVTVTTASTWLSVVSSEYSVPQHLL